MENEKKRKKKHTYGPRGGLYTAPHDPLKSAEVCQSLQDSGKKKLQKMMV